MTLHEFCLDNQVIPTLVKPQVIVVPDRDYKDMWSLFHLDDFVVTNVSAGSIWLVSRNPNQIN